jgi:hypothetical protein
MKMTTIDENTRKALADYTGPVTRCRPGRARAPAEKAAGMTGAAPPKKAVVMNRATVEWLKQHRADQPTKDVKAERKRLRRARAQRERIASRNAAVRKRRIGQGKST